MWLAKQETLTQPRAPGFTPGSWTETGVLKCPSQFTTVTQRRWCFRFFLCDTSILFVIYFSESLWIEYTVSQTDVTWTCDHHLTNKSCSTQKQVLVSKSSRQSAVSVKLRAPMRGALRRRPIVLTKQVYYITFALELVLRELCFMFCPFNICVKTRPPSLRNFLCLTPPILLWNFT